MRNGVSILHKLFGGSHRNGRFGVSCHAIAGELQANLGMATAFGTLLSSFELAAPDREVRSLLVTSTRPWEGKTTVALHLAVTGVIAGRRVLLIDGDLRRPSLHQLSGLRRQAGLGDVLAGRAEPSEVIQSLDVLLEPGAKTLDVITSGLSPPNTLQRLSTARVRQTLRELAQGYDMVIVDTPPALAVNDAELLAPGVDGTLLVVGSGDVEERPAQLAKERMARTGTPILGAVLNRQEALSKGYGGYPYQGEYTRSSQETRSGQR